MTTRSIAWIVGSVVAVDGLLVLIGAGPDLLLVAAIVTAIGAIVWATQPLLADAPRPGASGPPVDAPAPATPDLRTAALRHAFGSSGSSQHHAERIRERLVAVVDEQLLTVHGVDRTTDPGRARAILGPELSRLVDDPSSVRRLSPNRLDRLLGRVEAL